MDVTAARARALVSQEAEARLKALVGYTRIVAPYKGVVVIRNANTGDYVQPGSGDLSDAARDRSATRGGLPIYVVARTDKVRVYVDVPEIGADLVKVGSKATVRIQAENYAEIPGEVTRTSWALRAQSRTLRAEIDLPNPDARMLPGTYATGVIPIRRSEVRSVPSSAVVMLGNQNYCYLYEKGKAVQTAVQTGISDGKWVEVVRKRVENKWMAFTGDEQVILGDLGELSDGLPVRVSESIRKP